MISEKPLFMGIDAGSSKIRALIFDQKGKLISQASDSPKIYHSNIGWAHYDPQEIWETTANVIKKSLSFVDSPKRVVSVAVASVGETAIILDEKNEPIYHSIAWFDKRAKDQSEKKGIEPLATIKSYATAALDPAIMGVGPVNASRKALDKAGWSVKDLDLVEANEAFAAQALAVNQDMGWDPEIVNVNGGAIAIGHPIGASGARILNTLLFEMKRRDVKRGLATLCIGGGMGVAMCLER